MSKNKGGRPSKYNWAQIRKDLECGLSNAEIHKKYDVPYAALSNHLKTNPVEVNEHAKIADMRFREVSKQLNEVVQKRPDLVSNLLDIAAERDKHIQYFAKSILRNQTLANKLIDEQSTLSDLDTHSRLTNRNKDGVLGKQPDTQVNVQNNVIVPTMDDLYK